MARPLRTFAFAPALARCVCLCVGLGAACSTAATNLDAATDASGAETGGRAAAGGTPATGGRATGGAPATGGSGPVDAASDRASADRVMTDAGASGGGGAAALDAGSTGGGGPWRIMPLGDSITGSTCVPQLLSQKLKSNQHGNFVFVGGNLNNQSCGGAPNVMTEGHGGYLVTDLVGSGQHASELPQWCTTDKAELVLMHFGTNDAWNGRANDAILGAYATILADLRAVNPSVSVFVAQITPLNPANCSACESNVEKLNAAIPAWAQGQATAASPIFVVDIHGAFTASSYLPNSTYTTDGVHPNPAGSQLIADRWYEALLAHGLP